MKKQNYVPTMKDVAREAGVAMGTVSKVVNGIPVRKANKDRVDRAIRKLDYHVNSYAQGMKAGRTHTAALVIPDIQEPFFASLAYQVNLALLRRKYRMLLCCTQSDPSREREYVKMMLHNKVDGIIGLTKHIDLARKEGTVFVSLDGSADAGFPGVACDHFAAGQMAAEKLADFGCKRVAFLGAKDCPDTGLDKRQAGFEAGCRLSGLHCEKRMIGEREPLDGVRKFLAGRMPGGRLPVDGIFCMTDGLAYFVVRLLEGLGCKVPEDVQVIGFGGISIFGDGHCLCSTIVQPVREIAETSVELMLLDDRQEDTPFVCLPAAYRYGGTTLG